jgi:hypothetical protein
MKREREYGISDNINYDLEERNLNKKNWNLRDKKRRHQQQNICNNGGNCKPHSKMW